MLSSKGSLGTCIPRGLVTFLHAAFTAHCSVALTCPRRPLGCQATGSGPPWWGHTSPNGRGSCAPTIRPPRGKAVGTGSARAMGSHHPPSPLKGGFAGERCACGGSPASRSSRGGLRSLRRAPIWGVWPPAHPAPSPCSGSSRPQGTPRRQGENPSPARRNESLAARRAPAVNLSEGIATSARLQNRACDFHRTRLLNVCCLVMQHGTRQRCRAR